AGHQHRRSGPRLRHRGQRWRYPRVHDHDDAGVSAGRVLAPSGRVGDRVARAGCARRDGVARVGSALASGHDVGGGAAPARRPMMESPVPMPVRRLLMAVGMVSLVFGTWSGLARLGWQVPMPSSHHIVSHGPLMVCGFLGTMISLERAVALGSRWGYAAPVLVALGAI